MHSNGRHARYLSNMHAKAQGVAWAPPGQSWQLAKSTQTITISSMLAVYVDRPRHAFPGDSLQASPSDQPEYDIAAQHVACMLRLFQHIAARWLGASRARHSLAVVHECACGHQAMCRISLACIPLVLYTLHAATSAVMRRALQPGTWLQQGRQQYSAAEGYV